MENQHSVKVLYVNGILMLFSIFAVSGCIEARPIALDARPGIISGIKRIHAKVALATQNENTIRSISSGTSPGGPVGPVEGIVGETGMPISRELAKASTEVFSQVFDQVATLRQVPMPGEYDAVIQPKFNVMHTTSAVAANYLRMDYSFDWSLTVLNNEGVPIMNKKGTSPVARVEQHSIDTDALYAEIGSKLSALIASIVTEWAKMIVSSPEIREFTSQLQKP